MGVCAPVSDAVALRHQREDGEAEATQAHASEPVYV
jgi:hypothetical protein